MAWPRGTDARTGDSTVLAKPTSRELNLGNLRHHLRVTTRGTLALFKSYSTFEHLGLLMHSRELASLHVFGDQCECLLLLPFDVYPFWVSSDKFRSQETLYGDR